MRLVRHLMRAALAGLLALALLVGYLGWLQWTGNFHPVVPGEVYRSAQVTPASLQAFRAETGIRSILNLRGPHAGAPWYDREVATAEELGIAHFDFAMSDRRVLPPGDIARLVALMRDAPKPLLIHCKAGADRTGLAAALYLAEIAGVAAERAEGQLSIRYGHVGIPEVSIAWPMNQTWEAFERGARRVSLATGRDNFAPPVTHSRQVGALSTAPKRWTGIPSCSRDAICSWPDSSSASDS